MKEPAASRDWPGKMLATSRRVGKLEVGPWGAEASIRYPVPGIDAKSRTTLKVQGAAVGGSSLGTPLDIGTQAKTLWARFDSDVALKPTHMSVLIGANDLDRNMPAAWSERLLSYIDALRQRGIKVAAGTILPQCFAGNPEVTASFAAARKIANDAIKAAVGTRVDAVIDFAADARIGEDADGCDVAVFPDGTHPSAPTTQVMAEIYTPVADRLIGLK